MRSFLHQVRQFLEQYILTVVLVIIALASHWSLLVTPQFFRVHDFTHAARISEMSRALADGHFPVRWSENLGFGYGMPLYNFYAPLPYSVGALLYLVGFDVITSIKLLYIAAGLITLLSAYQLGKSWFGRWGGVLTSAAFVLAPYRAVNLFVRGALSEAWAMAFLPLILWGITRVIRKDLGGWKWLVIGLTGLFLSHNITTLLFVPVSGLVCLVLLLKEWLDAHRSWKLGAWLQRLGWLAGGYVLAGMLAAFYLFPAFIEKDFTKFAATILAGYFDYHLHFLYLRQFITPFWGYGGSGWGPDDGISFFLGFGQLLGAALAGLAGLWLVVRRNTSLTQLALPILAGAVFILAVFMSLERSVQIWDALPFLSFAQFPWRWLSVASFGMALLIGSLGFVLQKNWWRAPILFVVLVVIIVSNTGYFKPETYLETASAMYYTDTAQIQKSMSDILPDYIPQQMATKLSPPTQSWLNPKLSSKQVEVLVERTHERLYRVVVSEPTLFETTVADFPAWAVEVNGLPAQKLTGKIGTVAVLLPAGTHQVGIYWQGTTVENLSNLVSLLGVVFVLGLGLHRAGQSK